MDQIKTGRFIAEMRKEKKLTQRQLADLLYISDKTVSKWETGKGLPEVALMLPLCSTLDITVNELLCGERISTPSEYQRHAEENIVDLVKEKEQSKRNIILGIITVFTTIISAVTIIIMAGRFELDVWQRILLIAIAITDIVGGISVAAVLEMKSGSFECRHCGARFTPTASAYIAGPHTITTRYLKCPKCGKKSYCKRRLTH